jgi:hypothetical protein
MALQAGKLQSASTTLAKSFSSAAPENREKSKIRRIPGQDICNWNHEDKLTAGI